VLLSVCVANGRRQHDSQAAGYAELRGKRARGGRGCGQVLSLLALLVQEVRVHIRAAEPRGKQERGGGGGCGPQVLQFTCFAGTKGTKLLALLEAGMRACGRSCLLRKNDAACERAQRKLTYANVC
jgi:hypothetical protein